MSCERVRGLLGAFRDQELLPEERREVEHHLAECAACDAAMADLDRLGRSLRSLPRAPLPASLSARIGRALERADNEAAAQGASGLARGRPAHLRLRVWQAAALGFACLSSVLVALSFVELGDRPRQIEREVVSAHIRALIQEQQVQVASSDQHTVKPWFTGRTDFAPEVKDLASAGFPLVGGRLDYIDGKRVAALVYQRRLHTITVFMWRSEAASEAAPRQWSRNGFALLSWSRAGLTYWAVSDLNDDELRQLQSLL